MLIQVDWWCFVKTQHSYSITSSFCLNGSNLFTARQRYYEMSSFSENSATNLLKEQPITFVKYPFVTFLNASSLFESNYKFGLGTNDEIWWCIRTLLDGKLLECCTHSFSVTFYPVSDVFYMHNVRGPTSSILNFAISSSGILRKLVY